MTGHEDFVAADPEGTPNSVSRFRRQSHLIVRLRFLAECVGVLLFLITASTPFPVSVLTVESTVETGIEPVPVEETIRCEPLQVGRNLHRGVRFAAHESEGPAEFRSGAGGPRRSNRVQAVSFRTSRGHRWINGDRAPLKI